METDLESIQQCFRTAYEAYLESRIEAKEINDFYHNRQLSDTDITKLDSRGQPKETYNMLKVYGRPLLGYFDTVSTAFSVEGRQQEDQIIAEVMKGVLDYTLEKNMFTEIANNLKTDLMLTGLCCTYIDVKQMTDDDGTKLTDQWGRPQMDTVIKHVPIDEVVVDYMAQEQDFSDARFIHRFRWVPKEYVEEYWKGKVEQLTPNANATGVDAADFSEKWGEFTDAWIKQENYLIIHSIIKGDDKKVWSVFWSGDTELARTEVTHKNVKFPYLVYKLFKSNRVEYYGIFREALETQKAINNAVTKLAVLTSIKKWMVQEGGVKDINKFREQMSTALSIVEVKDASKINEVNIDRKITEHYELIDRGEERIRKMLSINLSFLGNAFASDSGRKVQLQQNATVVSLRYLTRAFEQLYRQIGWAVINTVKQYYHATQIISIVDEDIGQQFFAINQPLTYQAVINGQVVEKPFYEEVLEPGSKKPMSQNGELLMAPIARVDTDVRLARVDLKVDTTHAGLEEERNVLLTERVINSPAGTLLANVSPGDYLLTIAETARAVGTKESRRIAQTYAKVGQQVLQAQGQQGGLPPEQAGDTPVGQQPRETIPGGV